MPPTQFRRKACQKPWKDTDSDGLLSHKEIRNITFTSGFISYSDERDGGSVLVADC